MANHRLKDLRGPDRRNFLRLMGVAGAAFAQSTAGSGAGETKTSTPGAGCTATGNAMAGGNLGGSPQNVHCGPTGSTTAATTTATPATVATPSSIPHQPRARLPLA